LPSDDQVLVPSEQVPLAPLSTIGVGGAARWFVRATSAADVNAAYRWAQDRETPMFVLGGGSNLLIADRGINGLVLQMGISGVTFAREGTDTVLTAGAGESWDSTVAAAVSRGLAGLECLSGIPGTVGGTPIQNVGAYGQEVADPLDCVTAYDRTSGELAVLTSDECRFAYRMSRFKRENPGRFIVCNVTFRLRQGPPNAGYPDIIGYLEHAGIASPTVTDVREAVLAVRKRKGMVIAPDDPDTRSVGSFFMNPIVAAADRERVASIEGVDPPAFSMAAGDVKIPAAWLIERAGFSRGYGDGAAGISTKHTLALVNRGGATARDVLRLAARIKRRVVDRFGIWLRPEPVFVGFDHDPDVEYLAFKAEH
jgi:UDP-N-acetylmuramate dehydrogenase